MKLLAFDIETTGLDPYRGAKIFSFATCDEKGNTEVYRKNFTSYYLENLLKDTSIVKICHNFHFEYSLLKFSGYNIPSNTIWHDTMIMSQLLNNLEPSHALDSLTKKYGNEEYNEYDEDIAKAAKIYGSYNKIPNDLMEPYQRMDVIRTMILFKTFWPYIKEKYLSDYLNEIELVKTTVTMESRGVRIAKRETNNLLTFLKKEVESTEYKFQNKYSQQINLGSGKQIAHLLFNELKIPALYYTPSGVPAVDKKTLEELRVFIEKQTPQYLELFDMILKYRSYTRGITTIQSYIDASQNFIIHPHINTNRAQTGRQSSENPNMQNISKEAVLKNRYPIKSRQCFCARKGYILLLADYAGIEMRLIAGLSNEVEMINLIKENGDPHILAAELFYGKIFTKEEDEARKKVLRTAAKNSQFALAYGAKPEKIADTLGISFNQAEPGILLYCERFPLIANFTKTMANKIKKDGFVITPFDRRLKVRHDKPYSASNYIIQGTAAGILKRAQNRIQLFLEKTGYDIYQLLSIHDEIIFEYARTLLSKKEKILSDIKKCMINFPEINVPLEIEFKQSTYLWSDAKEMK
jgi:DNA polymerase I